MAVHQRGVAVTLGLSLAGALTGALSGVVATEAAVLFVMHAFPTAAVVAASSAIGAAFGGVVAPVLAWSALRRVPVGRAIAGIAAGAGLGGAIGVFIGIGFVVPHVPFALHLPPVPEGLVGALAGATLAAGYLRIRSRKAEFAERAG